MERRAPAHPMSSVAAAALGVGLAALTACAGPGPASMMMAQAFGGHGGDPDHHHHHVEVYHPGRGAEEDRAFEVTINLRVPDFEAARRLQTMFNGLNAPGITVSGVTSVSLDGLMCPAVREDWWESPGEGEDTGSFACPPGAECGARITGTVTSALSPGIFEDPPQYGDALTKLASVIAASVKSSSYHAPAWELGCIEVCQAFVGESLAEGVFFGLPDDVRAGLNSTLVAVQPESPACMPTPTPTPTEPTPTPTPTYTPSDTLQITYSPL